MRRPGHRSGAGRVLAAALLVAPVGAAGVFHVWTRTRVVAAGYELARLQREHDRLADERARLVIEVATLRAPGRLERFARERLGMAPPAPGAVVASVSGGKVLAGGVVGGGAGQRSGPAEPVSSAGARRPGAAVRLALRPAQRPGAPGAP
ncbi:MAG TPA: cell division protein FtsL [Anaeromyxobacteraceae bacterium]|nr:cell division protein FtsL [Anaeromyxobacteraceae bacterium]